jgi:tetratricopeptide (TPR) repeat protein
MYVNLADAYMGLGQYDKAARALQKAIELDPDYSLSHQNMGGVLVALGNHADAVIEYENALRLDPTNGFIISALGRCYLALGDLWRVAGRYWVLRSSGDLLAQFLADEMMEPLPQTDDE